MESTGRETFVGWKFGSGSFVVRHNMRSIIFSASIMYILLLDLESYIKKVNIFNIIYNIINIS